jgi:hypothetical protein
MTFGTWRWWDQPHAPAAFTPRKCSWYTFSLGADRPQGHGTFRRNTSLKNPVTPTGIDPGTVRLVAQRLNHYTTPGPIATEHNRSKHTWKTANGPHLGKIQITLSKHILLKSVSVTFCDTNTFLLLTPWLASPLRTLTTFMTNAHSSPCKYDCCTNFVYLTQNYRFTRQRRLTVLYGGCNTLLSGQKIQTLLRNIDTCLLKHTVSLPKTELSSYILYIPAYSL